MEQYIRLKRLKAENIDVSLSKFKHVKVDPVLIDFNNFLPGTKHAVDTTRQCLIQTSAPKRNYFPKPSVRGLRNYSYSENKEYAANNCNKPKCSQ